MRVLRRVLTGLGLVVLGTAAAAGAWLLLQEPASDAGEPRARAARAAPVEVATAATGRAATLVRATGTLVASDSVTVQPEIAGRIERILFDQGAAVRQGDPLVELDRSVLQAELAKARAALDLARQNAERTESLARRGAAAASTRDEARAALRTAEAEAELAAMREQKALIRAPFDGIVGLRGISPGLYVQPGDALVSLDRIDPLDLDFRVPERWFGALRPGLAIELVVDALPGQRFAGTITALAPAIDVNGRAVRVRASVPNPERVLRPGLFARVLLELEPRPQAVLVPEAAVVLDPGGAVVFRVEDGRARLVRVTTGVRRAGMVEIKDGLTAGDVVVVNGQVRLRDGIAVEIVTDLPPEATS